MTANIVLPKALGVKEIESGSFVAGRYPNFSEPEDANSLCVWTF